MAHTFVNPDQVVRTGIALVRDDLVLAQTVNRDYEAEYGGGRGSSVNVRIPATLAARTRALGATAAITTDELTESTVAVALDIEAYSAVDVTDAVLSLNIEDFARQVLAPQTMSLVEYIENKVAAEMTALDETTTIAWDATAPAETFTAARKALRKLGIPAAGLYAACGVDVYAALLDSGVMDAPQSGNADALLNAEVRRLRGFNIFESNRLEDGDIVFYHRDAFTLAVRAPKIPAGVASGRSLAENGFALRWIQDYDSSTLQDRSVVSTFVGTQAMTVKHLKADGTTEMVTPAIRVDTTTIPA